VTPIGTLSIATAVVATAALLLWPDSGMVARWRAGLRLTRRALTEDALKAIHKWESRGEALTLEGAAGTLRISTNEAVALLGRMQAAGLARADANGIRLTPDGRGAALHIIRAHRLWERYLAEETGFDEGDWHARAEREEHRLTPKAADELAAALGHPLFDPHGDPIPETLHDPVRPGGRPLSQIPAGSSARIIHLEDEPAVVYAQLLAVGLHPGMVVHVTESTPERTRFWTHGDEHVLAPLVAANVSVALLVPGGVADSETAASLAELSVGDPGEVVRIAPGCRGPERRRFLDLGIVPGTVIVPEMRSASGDPTAYRIRGALIALRASQARHIAVKRREAAS